MSATRAGMTIPFEMKALREAELDQDRPHFPRPAPIDSFGRNGFAFAGMSHRGSLLCLPSGIWASPVARAEDIDEDTLSSILAQSGAIGYFLIGSGKAAWIVPPAIRARFRANGMNVEAMSTGSAVSTYNILLGEGRPVGALLIAVE